LTIAILLTLCIEALLMGPKVVRTAFPS